MNAKNIVKAALVSLFALSVAADANALPHWNPPPPPPPPHVDPPSIPLPPFRIDSASFHVSGSNAVNRAAENCNPVQDWFQIRGPNVNLAVSESVSGTGLYTERRTASSSCIGPNCLEVYVEASSQSPTGMRTVSLKAIDGRVITASFEVKAATGPACPVPSRASAGSSQNRIVTSGTSGSSGSQSAPQAPQQTQQVVKVSDSRSKTCQGSALVMSNASAFTTTATQTVQIDISFASFSPCWCPSSTNGTCQQPADGTRAFVLRRADGTAISVPWKVGTSTVANLPAGTWTIDLGEGSVPPGSYTVTYTP